MKTTLRGLISRLIPALLALAVVCFVAFSVSTVFVGGASDYEDLSYLDECATPNKLDTAYAKETTAGTAAVCANTNGNVLSGGTASLSLSSVSFDLSKVTYNYYYTGNSAGNSHVFGAGKFGAANGDDRQGEQQKTYYCYVQLTNELLTAAQTGNLKVKLTATVGVESGDNQSVAWKMYFSENLDYPSNYSSISTFLDNKAAGQSKNYTSKGSFGAEGEATIPYFTGSTKYIIIGVSSYCEYGTFIGGRSPNGYIKNINLTFTYGTTFTVESGTHGSVSYRFYENATASSPGSPSTGTVSAGSSVSLSTANLYAYVVLAPTESVTGYRFDYLTVNSGNQYLGYASSTAEPTTDSVPKAIILNIPSNKISSYADSTSYRYKLNASKSCKISFKTRKYKISYFSSEGSPRSGYANPYVVAYSFTDTVSIPSAMTFFSNGSKVSAGWACSSYEKNGTQSTFAEKQFIDGNTLGNSEITAIDSNLITVRFTAVWVSASASTSSEGFSITGTSSYTSLYSDVTYTVSASKTGHTLSGVYATYTSGELKNQTIALEKSTSTKWILYGICGNCTLYPVWEATMYTIVYKIDDTTVYAGSSASNWTMPSTGVVTSAPYGSVIDMRAIVPTTTQSYTFLGWANTKTSTSYYDNYTVGTSNTLYLRYSTSALNPGITGFTQTSGSTCYSNLANSQSCNGVSGTGWKMEDKDGRKDYYFYAYRQIYFPGNIASYKGTKTVTVTINMAAGLKRNGGASTTTCHCKAYSAATAGSASSASWTTVIDKSNNSSSYTSGTSSNSYTVTTTESSFKAWIGGHFDTDGANVSTNRYYYVFVTSISYYVKTAAGTTYTCTYNLNLPSGAALSSNSNSSLTAITTYFQTGSDATIPVAPWDVTGYELLGWNDSASSSASSTYAPGKTIGITGNKNLYAIWRKKKFPVITFDVWTDGTTANGGTNTFVNTPRLEWYAEYNASVTLVNQTSGNSYSGSNVYGSAGGGSYAGFTIGKTGTLSKTASWTTQSYSYTTHGVASSSDRNTQITVTGAVWGYFIWTLKPATIAVSDAGAVYGNSINLDSHVTPSHEAAGVTFVYEWSLDGRSVQFYRENEPVIYAQSESGDYAVTVRASVTRNGTVLSRSATASQNCHAVINPIYLTVERDGSITTFTYNGSVQDFPAKAVVDSTRYSTADLPAITQVFETEKSSGYSYYYDTALNGTGRDYSTWKYGLTVAFVGLGYESYVGLSSEYFNGTIVSNRRQFKDAGKYWASSINLNFTGAPTTTRNTNFAWSNNQDSNAQTFVLNTLNSANEDTTVVATITPISDLKLTALYYEKEFGNLHGYGDLIGGNNTTVKSALPVDIDFENDLQTDDHSTWYLSISGMLSGDYAAYSAQIASALKRDKSSPLPQKAGSYDVYLDFSVLITLPAFLNNYGVKLTDTSSGLASACAIRMFWADENGSLTTPENREGYDFRSAVASYPYARNNYVIKPGEITVSASEPEELIYTGSAQGPSISVSSGLLSEEKQTELSSLNSGYGNVLRLYFYGLPLPKNWNTLDETARQNHINQNMSSLAVVGDSGNNYVTNATNNVITFSEINAGIYGVAILATAYYGDDNQPHLNTDYVLDEPIYIVWEIQKCTVSVTAQTTSTVFGNLNYGGVTFTFGNIVENESIGFESVTFTESPPLRYLDFSSSTTVSNGSVLSMYGSNIGTYGAKFNKALPVGGIPAASGKYGIASESYGCYGNNYILTANDNISGSVTVIAREISTSGFEYTSGGGYSPTKPSSDAMIYEYGVSKGARITLGNFFDSGFLTSDVSAQSSPHVLISASVIADPSKISVVRSATSGITDIFSSTASTATFAYLTVDAGAFEVSITNIVYTDKDGHEVSNLRLSATDSLQAEFAIGRKPIKIKWWLDSTPITYSNGVYGGNELIYDAATHSISYEPFRLSSSATPSTTDFSVYYQDYDEVSKSIYIYYAPEKRRGVTLTRDNSYFSGKNAGDYSPLLKQLEGNYQIVSSSESGGCISTYWKISRRSFTMQFPASGGVYLYDGTEKFTSVQLVADSSDGKVVEVLLENFSAVSGAHVTTNGARLDAARSVFYATNAGRYTLSYNAGASGVEIDANWILTGSASFTESNFLFAILPRVLLYSFNTRTATYNSQNRIAQFYPTPSDTVNPTAGDVTPVYNLTSITHAGTYTLTVTSATSSSGNFVLASSALSSSWYAQISNHYLNYYTSAETIASYSATITINPYSIALDVSTINAALDDFDYDGTTQGYTLSEIYDGYVDGYLYPSDRGHYGLTGSAATAKNAGNYNTVINGFTEYNGYRDYKLDETSYTFTWSIVPRELSVVFTEYHSAGSGYSYDGRLHGYTMTVSNIVEGEDINLSFTQSNLSVVSPLNVTNGYSAVLAGSAALSYHITFLPSGAISDGENGLAVNYSMPTDGADKSWTISRKTIEIIWKNLTVVYRASEYNPTNGGAYAEITNSVSGDEVQVVYAQTLFPTAAGEYTLSIDSLNGANSSNYSISGTLSSKWRIEKKAVTVFTWAGDPAFAEGAFDVTYDGNDHYVTATPAYGATADDDGRVYDADSVTFTYSDGEGYSVNEYLAGTYRTKISGFRTTINYYVPDIPAATREWTISPRELTVAFAYNYGTEITFCNAARGVVLTIDNIVVGDFTEHQYIYFAVDTDVEVDNGGSTGRTSRYTRTLRSVNVGDYSATVAIDENAPRASCYVLNGTLSASFKIIALPAIIEWELASHATFEAEYDGTQKQMLASVDNAYGPVTVTVTGGTETDAGDYVAVAAALSDSNYTLVGAQNVSQEWSITPRRLEVTWNADAYTYNGQYQSAELTIGRMLSADIAKFTVKFYKVADSVKTYTGEKTVAASGSVSYVFTASDFGVTVDAATYSAELSPSVLFSDGSVNGNYELPSSGLNGTYIIGRATVALSGVWTYSGKQSGTYVSGETALVYNASPYTFTTSIDENSLKTHVGSDSKDELTLNYQNNVRTHATEDYETATVASLSGTYAANYRLPTAGISLNYIIRPKGVVLFWEDFEDIVYDGQQHVVKATPEGDAATDSDGKIYVTDTVTVNRYSGNTGRNAVSYAATAISLDNPDYEIVGGDELSWAIAPRPVVLVWSITAVEYDGVLKRNTATASNAVSGDTVTFTYENNEFTDKGSYTAKALTVSNANYTLIGGVEVSHPWEITPITLELSRTGSNFVYNGNLIGPTVTVTGIVDSDGDAARLSFEYETISSHAYGQSVTVTAGCDSQAPATVVAKALYAGTYTLKITACTGAAANNYVLPANEFTYTVYPKPIAVTWSDDSDFVYGKVDRSVSATATNLVSTALVNDATIGFTYKTDGVSGNSAIHAGVHSTQVIGLDNPNYTLSGATGLIREWTIDPKPLTEITFTLSGATGSSVVYDGAGHTVTAAAVFGGVSVTDGKAYDGDAVALTCYREGSVAPTATTVGEYTVTVVCANQDYDVSDVTYVFNVTVRPVTLTISEIPEHGFVYNGKNQGVTVTLSGLVEEDNTLANLHLAFEFNGTAGDSVRSGTVAGRTFTGKDAGVYSYHSATDGGTVAVLGGAKASNYKVVDSNGDVDSIDFEFEIVRKEITTQIQANVTTNTLVYSAEAVDASNLRISFSSLVSGEALTLTDDFTVTYKHDGEACSAPVTVGVYTAVIALKESAAVAGNYELKGQTEFAFSIVPYVITPSDVTYKLDGSTVRLDSLSYDRNQAKSLTVSVSNTVFDKVSGKTFDYIYFGFCTCGISAESSSDEGIYHDHQWLLDNGELRTEGPVHAGSYCMVFTLSGGDAENFVLEGFDSYSGEYFKEVSGSTYLTYKGGDELAIAIPLPALGGTTAAVKFGISRSNEGVVFNDTPASLPYKGAYYSTESGLPAIVEQSGGSTDIRVTVNSVEYTYEQYRTSSLIKNAGVYTIRIYDSANISYHDYGCDLFSDDATFEKSVELTVEKSRITVTDISEEAWCKTYDKSNAYVDYEYVTATDYTYYTDLDADNNTVYISTTDGVISGTSVTISAIYDSPDAGNRTLTFTLGGADGGNYYLVFYSDETEDEATVSGNTYLIDAVIHRKLITVVGEANKVFDGTDTVDFSIDSDDIIEGDTVSVTGVYASEHVGNHSISITADNANYAIYSEIAARGTISPKALTVEWTGEASYLYDGSVHGISVEISGMVEDYYEPISYSGASIEAGTLAAGVFTHTFEYRNALSYTVNLSLGENSDYTLDLTDSSSDWIITPLRLTAVFLTDEKADPSAYIYDWEGYSVKYSATERIVSAEPSNAVEDDDVGFVLSGNAKTAAGSYTAEITSLSGADSGNYLLPSVRTQSWSIQKADIEGITMADVTAVYDAEPHGATVSNGLTQHGISFDVVYSGGRVSSGDGIVGNNALINVETDSDNNVIAVLVTASVAETGNYNGLSLSAYVKITPAVIQSITLTGRSFTYDKTPHSISVNSSQTSYGDVLEVTYTIQKTGGSVSDGNAATDAGRYTVVATIGANDLNYVYLERTATMIIEKADIDATRVTVGESVTVTYDSELHTVPISVTADVTQYGDPVTVTCYGGEIGGGARNAGSYNIYAIISAGDNYNDLETSKALLTINAKPITLTFPTGNLTYSGAVQSLSVTLSKGAETDSDGLAYDVDDVTVSLSYHGDSGAALGQTTLRNAGSYTVTATLSNDNYSPTNPTSSVNILKAQINGYYFAEYTTTYNARVQYLSVNTENTPSNEYPMVYTVTLLGSDEGSVTYLYNTVSADSSYDKTFAGVKNAGTYYVKAVIDGGANYEVKEYPTVLTINQAKITSFTLPEVTVTYDKAAHGTELSVPENQIYDGATHTVYGDAVTVTYEISDGENTVSGNSASSAGRYTVYAYLEFEDGVGDNYDTSVISSRLTISKASLGSITLVGGTHVYDGENHNAEIVLPSGNPALTLTETSGSTVLTATFSTSSLSDEFTVVYTVENDEGVSVDAINVGTYDFTLTVSASAEVLKNYNTIESLVATVRITAARMADSDGVALAKNVNIFFNDFTVTYDSYTHYVILASTEDDSILSHTASDAVTSWTVHPEAYASTSDVASVTYSVGGRTFSGAKNADSYLITARITHENYEPFTISCNLTVSKADIEYYLVGDSFTYDMKTHYASVSSLNQYKGDELLTTVSLEGGDAATVAYTYTSVKHGSGTFDGAIYVDVYSVTATLTVLGGVASNYNDWYTDNSHTVTLQITPYTTEIVWSGVSEEYTYNGQSRSATVSASFVAADGVTQEPAVVEILGISGKAAGDVDLKNAGNYTLTATHEKQENYIFTNDTIEVLIKKADIVRYLVGDSATYSATTTYYLTLNSRNASSLRTENETSITVFGEEIPITYTYSKNGVAGAHDYIRTDGALTELVYGARNCGVYTVTAVPYLGDGESNFNAWSSPLSASLTITRCPLTVTGDSVNGFDKVYDGTNAVLGYTITGVQSADAELIEFTAVYSDKHVGEDKTVEIVSGTAEGYEYLADNYSVSNQRGTISKRTVLPADTGLSYWTKMYDGTNASAYNPITLVPVGSEGSNNVIAGDALTLNAHYNSKNVAEASSVLFTLTGADSGNYTISDLDFSDLIDAENGVYLIYPRHSTEINWSARSTTYNGKPQTITAYIYVMGDDATDANRGVIYFPVDKVMIKDGYGNTLDEPIADAAYRNAGTYTVSVNVDKTDEADENTLINYGIASVTSEEFTIAQAPLSVVWSTAAPYVYNGEDRKSTVNVSAALLGDDLTAYPSGYLVKEYYINGTATSSVKNAGTYQIYVSLADGELDNNYALSNAEGSIFIDKASIDNIKFGGDVSWTYYGGEVHYFFAVPSTSESQYALLIDDADSSGTVTSFKYLYDPDLDIVITYYGGDISHSAVPGNNGVRNAGARTVRASVEATDNYKAWSATLTANVAKGTIDNIYLNLNNTVTYDGQPHAVYAHNDASASPSVYSQVVLPDNTPITVLYSMSVSSYFNEGYTVAHEIVRQSSASATDAGIYIINAYVENPNYEDLAICNCLLTIKQKDSPVTWEYNNNTVADFTYNATDQTSLVRARITLVGNVMLYLDIDISLTDEVLGLAEALKSRFLIAGNYAFSASVPERNDYEQLVNNYLIRNSEVEVEMKMYTVQISWYYIDGHNGESTLYDPLNPCVYDATEHGVRAEGRDFNDNIMRITTGGRFKAVNAGSYVASVLGIVAGHDTVSVNGVEYNLDYELNYRLANDECEWSVAKRKISINIAENNFLTKIYDGSTVFRYGTPEKIISTPVDSIVTVTFVYDMTNDKASRFEFSRFSYTLTNIIDVDANDVALKISLIYANHSNITASMATIEFDALEMIEENYELRSDASGEIHFNNEMITPREIIVAMQSGSHVYNGKSFSKTLTFEDKIDSAETYGDLFGEELFNLLSADSKPIATLYAGNYLIGTASIGGAINAGVYTLNGDFSVKDADDVENYSIISIIQSEYVIERRRLAVDYTGLLQSFNRTLVNVTGTLNTANSDYETDLGTVAELEALIAADGVTVDINNAWKSDVYTSYTVLNSTSRFGASASSDNYYVNDPVLQLTYLKISDANAYVFTVSTLNDLMNIESDSVGLAGTRNTYHVGLMPTYNQTADISGIVNGGYGILSAIKDFCGTYNGNGHSIKNLKVTADDGCIYVGFFSEITEGSVRGLKLRDVDIYAYGAVEGVGGLAGKIHEGVSVTDIEYAGSIFVSSTADLSVGGLFGTADAVSVSSIIIAAVIRADVRSANNANVGGLGGIIYNGTVSGVEVFEDITITLHSESSPTACGGVLGNHENSTITDYSYLAYGIYVRRISALSSPSLLTGAFGTPDNGGDGLDFDGIMNLNVGEVVASEIIRGYLFPSGQDGTSAHPLEITSFRQVTLLVAYPYMSFVIKNPIYSPIALSTYHRGFSGTVTYEGSASIRSAIPSEINLMDAVKASQQVIIVRKEDYVG